MDHRWIWRIPVVLGLTFAACSSDPAEVTTAGDDTDAVAESEDSLAEPDGPVANDSAPQAVDPNNEPQLAICASHAAADDVSSSTISGVTLDFEQQSYVAGDDATYGWSTGTIDFITSFYFTVECWDGDGWRPAWRAFVFGEPGYQSLSVQLGEVPAIGFGPDPGTVVIPPSAPAGTYRLVVTAPARDEETGERFDRMKVTGGFVVHEAPTASIADAPTLSTLAATLAASDGQPLRRSEFYLATPQGEAQYSGAERNPFFVVDIRQWEDDDGSNVIEVQFNNERAGGGQCGTYRSGLLVERADGLIEFREGEYPTVEGHGFGTVETIECGSIETVDFASIFAEPFEIGDLATDGFSITTSDRTESLFRIWNPTNTPAEPATKQTPG